VKSFERNERYFEKKGYGFGTVLSGDAHVKALRSMSKEQIEALLEIILLGDIDEISSDELLLGEWAITQEDLKDREAEVLKQLAATLVYLSGRLAEDFPMLLLRPPLLEEQT
jgi:hypothetical protein